MKKLILFFVALTPFIFNLNDPFVSDDWNFLAVARDRGVSLVDTFTSNTIGTQTGGSYRPITSLVWRLEYKLFGLEPWPFHLFTILLHLVNVFLVYILAKKLWKGQRPNESEWFGFLSALIFAILPNHAEAVAWISVVNDTLVTALMLGSLILLLNSLKKTQSAFWTRYILAASLFALAIFTKEIALVFPVIASLVLYLKEKNWRQIFLMILPFGFMTGGFFVARYFTIHLFRHDYAGNTIPLYWRTIVRGFLSFTTSNFLSGSWHTQITWYLFWWFVPIVLFIIGYWLLVVRRFPTKLTETTAFILCYLVALLPVLHYAVNFTRQYNMSEGERLVYFPSVFFSLVLARGFVWLWYKFKNQQRDLLMIFGLLGLVSFGALTIKTYRWHTAATLAESLITNAAQIIERENFSQIVVVGLPDMYHGAFIFRNSFGLALNTKLTQRLPLENILVADNRTLYDGQGDFAVERRANNSFRYTTHATDEWIVSAPSVTTTLYTSQLFRFGLEPWSISYTHFGRALHFNLSDKFVAQKRGQSVGVLFYRRDGFVAFRL